MNIYDVITCLIIIFNVYYRYVIYYSESEKKSDVIKPADTSGDSEGLAVSKEQVTDIIKSTTDGKIIQ